ncbi:glutamate:gamma-aminobutyrate antiporter [Chelatococcus asaccharovorans]|uniref:Glutamate/gamma-aminobutyrate antiporter n=1 Tax=Chelatococcus asaccharovorans TaxID=28210 RepID=A0A2V3UF90_9HYPH|nr:glutamate:gamma-aminobutyrate antiporter [Chelatococcus asaccharovorans]MBS7707366.1 glutamate:gamma-aminobutyrate antiporter [Chelatococcus asaccharovorans]PXW63548.1 glutamate:gamma-aminobutyrate antiporter (GGA family) [Chelatococcus asaccharovorans]CAH1650653.1 L-glutamate:4-aminobutyrate antiporter [Chelatococcus asaccharovorans]CAH1692436.1 L-glutamate:4-aminobutyrate antiporter [Chelatococcus asaccharovorans]
MAQSNPASPTQQLTLLGFFAITASMVMAVYEYPTFATSGFSLVFFLLLGGILWFIPVALCAAEMATVEGWEEGGVFAWVTNTLGERWGFAAISFTYLEIAFGFLPMIYFVLGALSYILNWPALNNDPVTKTIGSIVILWVLAFTQFGGTKYTAQIAKVGFFAGILLPALLLVVLAIWHLASGDKLEIAMNASTFFPDFTKIGTLVVFVAFILSYMGVEASATHVNEMKNPGRDYPIAMFLLMVAAIALSSIGGLSVASVVPLDQINLSAGVVQTFQALISSHGPGFEWAVRIVATLLVLGVLAEIAAWIVGPSRGMYVTAQHGILPAIAAKVNKNGVPVPLVIFQLCITTVALIVFTNMSGGNLSFLIAMSLTVVLYLITYFLLFLAYINLTLKHPEKKRSYRVPGSLGFKLTLAGVGFAISALAFVISFVPPSGLPGGESNDIYVGLLVVSFLIVLVIPFIVYALHDKRGKAVNAKLTHIKWHNAPAGHFVINPRARPTHIIVPNDN